eukprot:1160340-Pelagomonas_calceolata.AAC.8
MAAWRWQHKGGVKMVCVGCGGVLSICSTCCPCKGDKNMAAWRWQHEGGQKYGSMKVEAASAAPRCPCEAGVSIWVMHGL